MMTDHDLEAAQKLIKRAAELMRTSVLSHNRIAVLEEENERLKRLIIGEREARYKCMEALREKDVAMTVLFDLLKKSGIDYSHLIR